MALAGRVYLVRPVYLFSLVYPFSLVRPTQDRPDLPGRPIEF